MASRLVPELPASASGDHNATVAPFFATSWPHYDDDEMAATERVLASGKVNYWTGEEGRLFEEEYAEYTGCQHAVAVANGTLALELALRVLGIGQGDEVIIPSRTFFGTAGCAVAVGARPVCAEVDPESQNITADSIRAVLTPASKAIIAVHFAGWPCEMDDIMQRARDRGLKVIEDCAHAHGAELDGRPVGSMGDIGAFSFGQDKIITTAGEGGMITLNSDEAWERAWAYKDEGKSYAAMYDRARAQAQEFRWLRESFGTNWRLTEIQSAIGRLQLSKLNDWVGRRRKHAAALTACFAEIPGLRVTVPPDRVRHSYYKYYVFVRPEMLREGWDRDRIVAEIAAEEIPCCTGSCSEIYLEKAFPPGWRPVERYSVARTLGETSLTFQVHPRVTPEQIQRVCQVVADVVRRASVA